MPESAEGSCHCGAVRFRVRIDEWQALDCNCSICRQKGYLHLIVTPDAFQLLSGEDVLTTYEFNTRVAKHRFCKICGVHPFYTPRSHPNDIDVNVRCLSPEVQARFHVSAFDGQNWEDNVDAIR